MLPVGYNKDKKMKKTYRLVILVGIVIVSAFVFLLVGCKKREAPSAPSSASASVRELTICVTWSRVEDADSYEIYDGDGYYLNETYGTSYTDYSPREGYNDYLIYARNQYGMSSSYAYATCYYEGNGGGNGGSGNSAPSAPTGLSSSVSGSQIKVTWNRVSNATKYNVYWSPDGIDYSCYWQTSDTYIFDSQPYENNYYKVIAENNYGVSDFSSYTYCHYSSGGGGGGDDSAPSAPTGVSAEVSGSRVCVTWNSVSNASYYKVYRASSSSGSYSVIASSTSNTYYYDASPNTNNYYKVTAVNSSGTESEKSDYAYCYYSSGGGGGGGGGTTVPDAPTGVNAENYGNAMLPDIRISWNSVSNATSYKVYRSTSANGSYSQIGSSTTNTFLSDSNPRQGYNYYKVKAFNNAGGSSYSSYAVYNYDPGSQLSPCPVHYTSHTATSYQITLRWTNPTTYGCGTPTTAYLRVRNPDSGVYADLQTLSGSATSASFSYGMWADSEGYVYCGIITENSAGTSGGLPLVYNWKTNTWYGGNGKQYTEMMEMEELIFSHINQ
jgi:fibronectin type 3 domain-containing protein